MSLFHQKKKNIKNLFYNLPIYILSIFTFGT